MRVRFFSLGCRVNQVDAQALRTVFAREGFLPVEQGEAEVLVVNSCTVTSMADRKTRQLVRRLRREQPAAVLVLTGCLPQASPEAAAQLTEADLVTGACARERLPALVRDFIKTGRRVVSIPGFVPEMPFEAQAAERFDESFQRAYLKIEDGCDRFCAYCVIPHARGPVRSRALDEITAETTRLAAAGYHELVLTGINLSRYGAGEGLRLADAVRAACEVPGDFRVRLGSVEPVLLGEADYRALSGLGKLCPQFHLALQSGCDQTLARMNRRYTTAEYADTVRVIRALFHDASITTDLIVGFPGETDAEFEQTCQFVRSLGLLRGHVFEYSPRAGTPAAAMPGQIAPEIKHLRAQTLLTLCRESGAAVAAAQVGKTVRVLAEATGGGYTDNYLFVRFAGGHPPAGALVTVRLTGVDGDGCTACWAAEHDERTSDF